MLQLLSAPETLTAPAQSHRFMADVASNQLDFEGVPVDVQTIDVLVIDPSEAAIKLLIASTKWLKGYSLIKFWEPEDGCDCF